MRRLTNAAASAGPSVDRRAVLLGVLAVAIFGLSLPMTRLAVGAPELPLMSGSFVAAGRAVIAAALSALFLLWCRAPWPSRGDWAALAVISAGVVLGFPLFSSIAMRHVQATHASVVVGALPLATAIVAALLHRQRPSVGFWLCAITGCALVMAFAIVRSATGLRLQSADLLLLAAIVCAAVGYAWGARLSQRMRAEQVICWALLLALPVTLPLAWWSRPQADLPASAWAGLAYVGVFAMWIGFFAWYRALALGGTVRISQLQLLQPFLGMAFAVPLLGERIDGLTAGFALAVVCTVFVGKRMPLGDAAAAVDEQPVAQPVLL